MVDSTGRQLRAGVAMTDDGWDGFWRGTREGAAHQAGGPQDEVLARFWTTLLMHALPDYPHPRVLDVACGNGAVAHLVFDSAGQLGGAEPSVHALDRSLAALRELRKRVPSIKGVVADANQAPFPDRSFDLVASQFGLEYAGIDALGEAARLVASGGVLATILHLKNGAIYRECAINLEAVQGLRDCALLPHTRRVFEAGMGVNADRGDGTAFRRADREFAPAVAATQRILSRYGPDVAGGVVQRLLVDIEHMYRHMSGYALRDVLNWIDQMAAELDTYILRMSSMLDAAIDERDLDQMLQLVTAAGLIVRMREPMRMGKKNEAAAWVLVCDRRRG